VNTGRVSSFDAATITWDTASEKAWPLMVPATSGSAGKEGYSSTGMVAKWNRERPQETVIFVPSVSRVTVEFGNERVISASNLPEIKTLPCSAISAGISMWDEIS